MALGPGGDKHTIMTFVENGRVIQRRVHLMKVVDKDGKVNDIEGDRLPDYILMQSGKGYKGNHLGQILLGRNDPGENRRPIKERWPNIRDVGHLVIGISFVLLLSRIVAAVAEMRP